MLLRIVLFIVMAVGLAGFGAVAWISTRPPATPPVVAAAPPPPPAKTVILAAAHTLRAGTLLKPDDLQPLDFVPAAAPAGGSPDTPAARAALFGAMLRHTLLAGQPVLPADVVRAGDRGFLAAVLEPGMRASTVGVDVVTGTAGLIWPGDHVDLILTQTMDDQKAAPGHRVAGETVLRNVRVIAIDQELIQGASPGTVAGNAGAQTGRTVTLEVSPSDAERVAVATRLGHLSLSVISADAPAPAPAPATAPAPVAVVTPGAPPPVMATAAGQAPVTWGGDVSAALQNGHRGDSGDTTLRLFDGASDGKEFHF